MEGLSAVLVVSTSWKPSSKGSTTWELITDFCENTFAKQAYEPSQLYCTVLDDEVSEELRENATKYGVTLISATRPEWSYRVEDPPAFNWLLNHQIYYPGLGKLDNVGHVVGLHGKTSIAASAIHESLFPQAKLHLLDFKPGAVFVADAWSKDELGLTAFHRILVQDFCARKAKAGESLKAYSTVLEVKVSDDQKTDAESCCVTLIPAQMPEWADPKDKFPALKWLQYHEIHYPELRELENIQYVVGYAPKTGHAAIRIHKTLFPTSKLVLINHVHPHSNCLQAEEYGLSDFEDEMLRMASAADLIFSIGPKIHQYFKNHYRVEVAGKDLSEIPHEEILPMPNTDFRTKKPSKLTDLTQHNVLTYGQIDRHEDIIKCKSIATAISTAAKDIKTCNVNLPEWRIQVGHQHVLKPGKDLFADKKKTSQVLPTLCTGCSAKSLLKSLQQAHLCIPTQFYRNYSFHGLEAMVFGLPTFLHDNSDVAYFIKKYFAIYGDTWIVENPEKNLAKKILQHLANTPLAFQKAKALKEQMCTSDVISASYATFASLLKSEKRTEDVTKDMARLKKDEKDSVEIQIELDRTVYPHHCTEVDEHVNASSAQPRMRQNGDETNNREATSQFFHEAMKRRVQEVRSNGDGDCSQEMKKICKDKLGDVNLSSFTSKSLAILLKLLTLYNLYRLKQTCRSGGLAKAFEPLLITEEMRKAAAEVGITLRLRATYDQERFKEVELFFINRDGGGIQPMIINDDALTESEETEEAQNSSDDGKVSYVQEHPSDICMDDHHEKDKESSKLLLLGLDPNYELKPSTETVIRSLFQAKQCTRQKGKHHDMIQLVVKVTDSVQDILSSKQEVLALLGVTSYLLIDTGTEDLTSLADMEEHLTRDGTKLLSLPVSHENVTLLARSLIPFQMSQIVEKLSVPQHQLDEVSQEKATLKAQNIELTKNLESTEKSLIYQLRSITEKFTVELKEKENAITDLHRKLSKLGKKHSSELEKMEQIITDLRTKLSKLEQKQSSELEEEMTDIIKLSELEEKQPESKIQGVEDNKFEQQYSKRTERVNEKVSVQGFQQDSGNSGEMKTKPTEQELISGEISETAASTATRPDRPGKERRKVKRATSETTAYDRGHWSRKNVNVYQGQEKFKTICGLAFHNDKLLVCDKESGVIQILNRDYKCEKALILSSGFGSEFAKQVWPECIVVTWDNLLLLLDDSNLQIVVFDQKYKIIRLIVLRRDTKPSCIALVKSFVIVTDVKGHRVLKYSLNGQYVAEVGGQGDGQTKFNDPYFVAVNSRDVIMVSDCWNHCIKCFDTEFNYLYQYGQPGRGNGQLSYPLSIAVDRDDNVYVCDYVNNRISMWSRDGAWKRHLFQHELIDPWHIAVTANGDRIAVDGPNGDEIVVYSK